MNMPRSFAVLTVDGAIPAAAAISFCFQPSRISWWMCAAASSEKTRSTSRYSRQPSNSARRRASRQRRQMHPCRMTRQHGPRIAAWHDLPPSRSMGCDVPK